MLRRAVDRLKSINAELQAEIAQVVRSLSIAIDSLPTQLEEAASYDDPSSISTSTRRRRSSSSTSSAAEAAARLGSHEPEPCSPVYHQPPDVAHAILSCSVPHPGALCCTKTSVTEMEGAFIVDMSTTARSTRGELSRKDLAALGARALECAAVDFSRARSADAQAAVLPCDRLARHAALCEILADGRIISAEHNPIVSPYGHESFLLELEHPRTGVHLRGLLKPRVPGDSGGWHRAAIEVVAYRLNLLLGLDYVPPAVYRTGGLRLHVEDAWVELDEGSVSLWVDGAQLLEVPPGPEAFLSDTRILDVLIHNSDRHRGHFLAGPHWATGPMPSAPKNVADSAVGGSGRASAAGTVGMTVAAAPGLLSPVLIDHAAGFRKEAFVMMEHENAFCTGPVRCVRATTYLRLRLLDRHTCKQHFGEFLGEQEIREMLHRRNYVLRYLDNLVAKQGFEATVIE